ncbi:MAG: transposase [Nitrococcus mobilis]|nr:transposase [Nitrococcus mobilis]
MEEPSTTRRSQRSRESRGWYSRGYLPHVDGPGLIQHITFHLADSLPREAVARMEQELVGYPEDQQAAKRRQRIQSLLDSGLGSCIFDRDDHARIVEKSLLFGDGERYRLLAWVIMPNHVHVLIEQKEGWLLAKIVQSWKRHTSREIRRLGLPSCTRRISPLWQRDYWDRFIRNERHFQTAKQYIENNPVVAGLIDSAERWPWGSARFRELPSATRRSQER